MKQSPAVMPMAARSLVPLRPRYLAMIVCLDSTAERLSTVRLRLFQCWKRNTAAPIEEAKGSETAGRGRGERASEAIMVRWRCETAADVTVSKPNRKGPVKESSKKDLPPKERQSAWVEQRSKRSVSSGKIGDDERHLLLARA